VGGKRLRIMITRAISLQKTDCRVPITLTLNLNIILPLTLFPAPTPTLTLSLKPEVEDEENGFCISVVHRRLASTKMHADKKGEHTRHDTTTTREIKNPPKKQEGKPVHNRGGEGKKQNLKPWI
jgi:hypothetical protein